MTITEAIMQVMRLKGAPMTVNEAYRAISDAKLYEFHTDSPLHVVRAQIRRHCDGLDFPSAAQTKYFRLVGENRFEPLEEAGRQPKKSRGSKVEQRPAEPIRGVFISLDSRLRGITSDLPACLAMVAAQQREPGGDAPCGCGLSRMASSSINDGANGLFGLN